VTALLLHSHEPGVDLEPLRGNVITLATHFALQHASSNLEVVAHFEDINVSNLAGLLFWSLATAAQPLAAPTISAPNYGIDHTPVAINCLESGPGQIHPGQAYPRNAKLMAQRRDPNEVWREIKSLAEQEAVSPSQPFIQPLTIKIVGSTIQLRIKLEEGGDLGFGEDPYQLPIKEQILIEALRHALADRQFQSSPQPDIEQNRSLEALPTGSTKTSTYANANERWQCYLDQAQHLVRQMVVALETVTDKNQLKQVLQEAKTQIDEILYSHGQLFDSIANYADEHHYIVVYERGGSVKPFSVSLVSIPDGAKVWLMTDLVYRKQLIVRTDPTQWPWREIVQNPADLIGKYRYIARWPDGRHAEGSIDVTNSNPLRFQP